MVYTVRYNGESYFSDVVFQLTDDQKELAAYQKKEPHECLRHCGAEGRRTYPVQEDIRTAFSY